MEFGQLALYGTAKFSASSVSIPAGRSQTISVAITPPANVESIKLPVSSGFIQAVSELEKYSIPYLGPPYSLYTTPSLLIRNTGVILPQIYGYNSNFTATVDTGFLAIDPTYGYGSVIAINQWIYEARLDVLPANTNITATYYAPNTTIVAWNAYHPSLLIPTISIFGYPSFGTLVRNMGYTRNLGANAQNTLVTTDSGSQVAVGTGAYR
ncbi:hypothetical protein BJ878DRAFT_293639 [Calycina marina]|uniref:C5a peptidase/Subtilisin-like protease SBT2-like Fn3-like domain-containing protein n=1 Tax=Calycina marina TaxID=1763456 RepID=A0A9P7Z7K5_9HELO|nr:hypothetical protein BJ878DRAFT_293639 [Calycina marina]